MIKEIKDGDGYKRDLKDFSGTTDDSSIGSSGHGSGGRGGRP